MRKQHSTWISVVSAGLLSACSAGDTGTNSARPTGASPQSPTANELTTVVPGDIVGGVTVANLLEECPAGSLPARTGRSLAVDPQYPNIVYVGVEGAGLFRSIDAGATWQPMVRGLKAHYLPATRTLCFDRFTSFAVDPRDRNHLCVGVRGAVATASDDLAAAAGVYCSTDGGQQWTQQLPAVFSTAVDAVAIAPRGAGIAAGIAEPFEDAGNTDAPPYSSRVAISRDSGATWNAFDVAPTHAGGVVVSDLTFASGNPDRLYAGVPITNLGVTGSFESSQFGLMLSLDGGSAWRGLTNGMVTRMASRAVVRVASSPAAPERLMVATAAQRGQGGPFFYWSSDGGESFHLSTSKANLDVDLFAFDPSDRTGTHALAIDSANGTVFESHDGGDNWIALGSAMPADTITGPARLSHLVWSADPLVLFASGSHSAVYRSQDGGHSWARVLVGSALPVIGDPIP